MPQSWILWIANVLIYLRHPGWTKKFYRRLGYLPHVALPRTVNEKLFWRKVFDRNPTYSMFSDKLAVRTYVRARCPDLEMSEIVWVGNRADAIPDRFLKRDFVVKTTNGSSRNVFFDENPADRATMEARVQAWLAEPYGVKAGQWTYGHVPALAVVERMICDRDDPRFVEFYCFVAGGRVRLVMAVIHTKRATDRRSAFDRDGRRLEAIITGSTGGAAPRPLPEDFQLPANFASAVAYAETIAGDCDFVRVDFMSTGERLYFGECTLFPTGGYGVYHGDADARISPHWDLRRSWFLSGECRGILGYYAAALRQAIVEEEA